jgi:hypothetical protein
MTSHVRAPRSRFEMRPGRARTVLGTALLGALLALVPLGAISPAAAAPTIAQCDGVNNAAAAEVQCRVTVENSLDSATGAESSIVTVVECIGVPGAVTCGTPVTTSYTTTTTTIDQCNGSGNAGGSIVRCDVAITNIVTNATAADQATVTPATVNQCAGSGGGASTLNCDSYDTTTGATITQCNGSVNGGGAPTRVNCTVGPSTQTAILPVLVNQCTGSANGGGALMFCNAVLVNDIRLAAVVPPVTPGIPTPPTAPEVPGTPGISGAPGIPGTPGTPGTPGAPFTPNTPGVGTDALAATGADAAVPASLGLASIVIGGVLALIARRRRSEARP